MVARPFDGPESPTSNLGSLRKRNSDAKTSDPVFLRELDSIVKHRSSTFELWVTIIRHRRPPIPSKSPAHASLLQILKSSTGSKRLASTSRIPVPGGCRLSTDYTIRQQPHLNVQSADSHSPHIPGSFSLETSSSRALRSSSITPDAASLSGIGASAAGKAQNLRGSIRESIDRSSTLSEHLNNYSDNGSSEKGALYEPIQIQSPSPRAVGRNLLTSLYSQRSSGTPYHFLLRPSADPLSSEFPAPPIMTYPSNSDYQHMSALDDKMALSEHGLGEDLRY
jgi:hypothetical protein